MAIGANITNERGSILLMVVGISAIIFVSLLLILDSTKRQKSDQVIAVQNLFVNTINSNINSYLSYDHVCLATLQEGTTSGNFNGNRTELTKIGFGSNILIEKAQRLGGGIKVENIYFEKDAGQADIIIGSNRKIKAKLIFELARVGGGVVSNKKTPISFYVTVDASERIVGCSLNSTSANQFVDEQCDTRNLAGGYRRSLLGTEYTVHFIFKIYDSAMDDGGLSGYGDELYAYCVSRNQNRFGQLALCLSGESCPWR